MARALLLKYVHFDRTLQRRHEVTLTRIVGGGFLNTFCSMGHMHFLIPSHNNPTHSQVGKLSFGEFCLKLPSQPNSRGMAQARPAPESRHSQPKGVCGTPGHAALVALTPYLFNWMSVSTSVSSLVLAVGLAQLQPSWKEWDILSSCTVPGLGSGDASEWK